MRTFQFPGVKCAYNSNNNNNKNAEIAAMSARLLVNVKGLAPKMLVEKLLKHLI